MACATLIADLFMGVYEHYPPGIPGQTEIRSCREITMSTREYPPFTATALKAGLERYG
jgi:hypothetical protein